MDNIQEYYKSIGVVHSIGDGIINIIGLEDAANGEMIDILIQTNTDLEINNNSNEDSINEDIKSEDSIELKDNNNSININTDNNINNHEALIKKALILNLGEKLVSAICLSSDNMIKPGQFVALTNEQMSIPVGDALLGRVVNPLGEPLDEAGDIISES
jgi:F0F1-type ATP synthase alpha subunit